MTPANPTQAAQLLTELKNVQFNSQYEDAKEAAEKWLLTNLSRIIEALTAQLSPPRGEVDNIKMPVPNLEVAPSEDKFEADLSRHKALGWNECADTLRAETGLFRKIAKLLHSTYRQYEDGITCYEDPENCAGPLGQAFKLGDMEGEILEALSQYDRLHTHGYLTPRQEEVTALGYFSKNIDGRTALEVFESLVTAMKKADAACVAKDDVAQATWFNIAKCEMMRIAREYEYAPVFRKALSPPPDDLEAMLARMKVAGGSIGSAKYDNGWNNAIDAVLAALNHRAALEKAGVK